MKDLHAKLHTLIGKYGLRGLIAKVSATLWAELRAGLALPVLLYPARVRQELRPGDMLLTVGAGDVYKVGEMLAEPGTETRKS